MFSEVLGQAPAVETLTRALAQKRVHHAYRFEGPDGVGKELCAFALAQALVCESGQPLGCGKCGACRKAVRLSEEEPHVPVHPDVVLVERGLYPPALLGTDSKEVAAIGAPQIRKVILSRLGFSPHEGRALVFIIRNADELSPSAANALLKTLEEPPAATHFILLTSRPKKLLDTIRSRTLPVRFGPLPESDVAKILEARGLPGDLARFAAGSAAVALALADEALSLSRREFVQSAEAVTHAEHPEAFVQFAAARPDDRDALQGHLSHLAQHFALQARDAVHRAPEAAELAARRHAAVLEAMDAVAANGQPALVLESLASRLHGA